MSRRRRHLRAPRAMFAGHARSLLLLTGLVAVAAALAPVQVQAQPEPLRPGELEAASEATRHVLAAWHDGDRDALRERSLDSFHATLEGTWQILWEHMTVHEVGEPRPTARLNRRDLEFEFAWQAELDADGFVDAAMQRMRERAAEQGLAEQFDETAEGRRQRLERWAALQAEAVEFAPQRLVMRRASAGWKLAEWLTVELGASEPDVAAALFLAAFATRDPTQARGSFAPEFRRAFSDRIGRHLLLGSVVRHHEQTSLERPQEGPEDVAYAHVSWQVDFRPEWVERHLLEEYRWELEFDDEARTDAEHERLINEFRDEVERRTTAFAKRVETFAARLKLERHLGRWYVADIEAVEVDVEGGAPNPEQAVRAGLQALRNHDFEGISRLYDPARSDGFGRSTESRRVARALTLESFELGEEVRREAMPRRARLLYTWDATLDVEALKEEMREEYREHMRQRGHNDEMVEELLRDREPRLTEYVEGLREELEQQEQAAELRRIGENWFLIDLVAG